MNVEPVVAFLWRRSSQLKAMVTGGSGPPFPTLAVVEALLPWLKAKWPALNAKGEYDTGLLDDALETYKAAIAPITDQIQNSKNVDHG